MILKNNPFFLLDIKTTDNRRAILSKSDELEFTLGGDVSSDAINSVITPSKRLPAEIGWFLYADESSISNIRNCIQSNQYIPTQDLESIDRINAIIYDIELYDVSDPSEMASIVEILDEQLSYLDIGNLTERINSLRGESGFPNVTYQDISKEINGIRETIKHLMEDITSRLSNTQYVSFITSLANKYNEIIAVRDSAVIGDIIDLYEVRTNDKVQEMANAIMNKADAIENAESNRISLLINDLIFNLKEWDKYAQPLQLKAMADGITHEPSRLLARRLFNLTVVLNNDKDSTAEALKLTKAMQEVFAELTEMIDGLNAAGEKLEDIAEEQEQTKAFINGVEEKKNADLKYRIVLNNGQYKTPPYCTCCMQQTTNTEKTSVTFETTRGFMRYNQTISVDLPLCDECVEHVKKLRFRVNQIAFLSILIWAGISFLLAYYSSMDMGLILFLTMVGAILSFVAVSYLVKAPFIDDSHTSRGKSVKVLHGIKRGPASATYYNRVDESQEKWGLEFSNWGYAQLFLKANEPNVYYYDEIKGYNSSKRKTLLTSGVFITKTILTIGIVGFIVFGFISMVFSEMRESRVKSALSTPAVQNTTVNAETPTPTPTAPAAQTNNTTPSSNGSVDSTYSQDLVERLAESDRANLQIIESDIHDLEDELEGIQGTLEMLENDYNNTGDESYLAQYNSWVETYNDVYAEYTDLVDEYNERVREYNKKYAN